MEQIKSISNEFIKKLDKEIATPFYLFYPDVLAKNIEEFRNEFIKIYPNFLMGYSFKTNYVPSACNVAKLHGCYAEVVSDMEYDLALKLGFAPNHIIFNGPVKNKATLMQAFENKSIVNLDSENDIQVALEFKHKNPNMEVAVGLRININLVNQAGESKVQNSLRSSRFGFTEEMLAKYIPLLLNNNIKINSVHGHTSSFDRGVDNYCLIAETLLATIETYQLEDIDFFNLGGGFFGAPPAGFDVTGKPTYSDYAENIIHYLMKAPWFATKKPTLVIEPGSSILTNTFELCTKITQIKKVNKENFIIVDSSIFEVKPSMHSFNLPFELLSNQNLDTKATRKKFQVVGSTCMEKDIILKNIEIEQPRSGDYIVFKGVGAYTVVFNPMFINYLIPIVAITDKTTQVIRNRQNIENLLSLYND